ncbi:hypothetical protein Syun_004050 [Stephania yunnanensis]|uniref:Uncharacterized protein n=1 Tax=Stephania yunnanensis TaxID=152371 RepID=A0AAP0Q0T8_9MAGN
MAKSLYNNSLKLKYSTLDKATGSFNDANKLGQDVDYEQRIYRNELEEVVNVKLESSTAGIRCSHIGSPCPLGTKICAQSLQKTDDGYSKGQLPLSYATFSKLDRFGGSSNRFMNAPLLKVVCRKIYLIDNKIGKRPRRTHNFPDINIFDVYTLIVGFFQGLVQARPNPTFDGEHMVSSIWSTHGVTSFLSRFCLGSLELPPQALPLLAAGTPADRCRNSYLTSAAACTPASRRSLQALPPPAARRQHSRCSSQALLLLAEGTPTAGTHSRMLDISQTSAVLSSAQYRTLRNPEKQNSKYFHKAHLIFGSDLAFNTLPRKINPNSSLVTACFINAVIYLAISDMDVSSNPRESNTSFPPWKPGSN